MLKQICALLSCAFLVSSAQAYNIQTVFKTEHFAINQIVLDEHEKFDVELEYLIIRDVQTKNRLEKKYQSTTVVFPHGSQGLTGKINTPALGILTVANYGSGEDQIVFNNKKTTATNAGLYLSYDFLVQMIDNRMLNSLLGEITRLPLVLTDIPVSHFSVDFKNNKYISSRSKAVILDLNIVDSVYYKAQEMAILNDKCKVNVLAFVDRALPGIPLFLAAHGALNKISCPEDKSSTTPQTLNLSSQQ